MKAAAASTRGALGITLTVFLLAGAAVSLGGCNTTAGAGQDVSAGGHAVTNAAEKTKNAL